MIPALRLPQNPDARPAPAQFGRDDLPARVHGALIEAWRLAAHESAEQSHHPVLAAAQVAQHFSHGCSRFAHRARMLTATSCPGNADSRFAELSYRIIRTRAAKSRLSHALKAK